MISSVYGSGIEFRTSSGRDRVARSDRNRVINMLLPMHIQPRPSRFGAVSNPGQSFAWEHCTFEKGAPIVCNDGKLFLWKCNLLGSAAIDMKESRSEVVIAASEIGEGIGRRRIAYARLLGCNSSDFWSASMGRADAKQSLLRANVEYLLNQARHAPFKHLADIAVLVLGDFNADGRERLRRISSLIEDAGYQPILVDEIEDIPQHSLQTKVITLASVCRFVVVDDSSRSGHLTEMGLLRNVETPVVHLQKQDSDTSAMTLGFDFPGSHFLTQTYVHDSLSQVVADGIEWAETRIRHLEERFNEVYRSWRQLDRIEDWPFYGIAPSVRQSAH